MKQHNKILILIFILVLAFRLHLAFQTSNFNYEAYFNYRQINEISKTAMPVFNDSLSYGGRTSVFIPTFHYILAFFNLFLPSIFTFKILPNIFASSLIFIVFLITRKITQKNSISLLAAFISGFIPIFVAETVNNISVYTLVTPIIFLAIYFFMHIENKKFINYFTLSVLFLSLLHPASFLLIAGLLLYLIQIRLERLKYDRAELELILFSTFFVFWILFLVYKTAFLLHGSSIIWQNIPFSILSLYFSNMDILKTIIAIGLVPLFYGIFIIYKYLFREKNKNIYLLISFAISTTILLWLKLIEFAVGLSFLGIILTLLFAQYYKLFLLKLEKIRFAFYRNYAIYIFIIAFIITSVIPSYYFAKEKIADSPTAEEIEALFWLKENSNENSTVLGTLTQGHLIAAIANRKNVIDSNFILIENPEQRLEDIQRIYKTQYKTEAVGLLNKYNVNYILFSNQTKAELKIDKIFYIDDKKCFKLVYDKGVRIYQPLCKIEEI